MTFDNNSNPSLQRSLRSYANGFFNTFKNNNNSQYLLGRSDNSTNFNVLLIGETGSGKSSFINTLTNFFRGGSISNLKIAIPTQHHPQTEFDFSATENGGSASQSQTNSCTIYSFLHERKDGPKARINFIDTPGLSDTRGNEQDDVNIDKILKAAEDAETLHAIILVINGTLSRSTVTMKNVMARLRGSLPDSVLDNTILLLTNCWSHSANFPLDTISDIIIKSTKPFYMNNCVFSTNLLKISDHEFFEFEFGKCLQTVNKMVDHIFILEEKASQDFKLMRDLRFQIKHKLHDARLQIVQLQKVQDEIEDADRMLKQFQGDEQAFKNYTKQKIITKHELVDAPYHSTICSTCSFVCHNNCGLEEISTVGSNAFTGCACMNGSNCGRCPGKCSHTTHYHARKTMKEVTTTLDEVLNDIKSKFDAATQGVQQTKQKISSITDAKKATENAITELTQTFTKECQELKQICSGFNLVDELDTMVKQLETESRSCQSHDAKRTSQQFIDSVKQISNSLTQCGLGGQAKKRHINSPQVRTNAPKIITVKKPDFSGDNHQPSSTLPSNSVKQRIRKLEDFSPSLDSLTKQPSSSNETTRPPLSKMWQ